MKAVADKASFSPRCISLAQSPKTWPTSIKRARSSRARSLSFYLPITLSISHSYTPFEPRAVHAPAAYVPNTPSVLQEVRHAHHQRSPHHVLGSFGGLKSTILCAVLLKAIKSQPTRVRRTHSHTQTCRRTDKI